MSTEPKNLNRAVLTLGVCSLITLSACASEGKEESQDTPSAAPTSTVKVTASATGTSAAEDLDKIAGDMASRISEERDHTGQQTEPRATGGDNSQAPSTPVAKQDTDAQAQPGAAPAYPQQPAPTPANQRQPIPTAPAQPASIDPNDVPLECIHIPARDGDTPPVFPESCPTTILADLDDPNGFEASARDRNMTAEPTDHTDHTAPTQ